MSRILYRNLRAIMVVTAVLGTVPLGRAISQQMPAPASQSQPPDFGDPRFAFHRIDGGFLRLDMRTGVIAACSQGTGDWTCVPGREERASLEYEIARLQRDNAILKNALLERGLPLPDNMKAEPAPATMAPPPPAETVPRPPQTVPPSPKAPPVSSKSAEPDRTLPDDAEIERIMVVMEKVWRRLVEMMLNIQRDMQKKG